MTKKNKDKKEVTLEQESKKTSSNNFEKIKSSFTNTIQSADDLVHPKAGKISYLVFKIMTILTFTVGIPLFVLFYQFSIIDDAYTFEDTPVVYSNSVSGIERSLFSTQQFTYEAIDQSIAEIEALSETETFEDLSQTNVFVTSYRSADDISIEIVDTYGSDTYSYFYSIFIDTDELSVDD